MSISSLTPGRWLLVPNKPHPDTIRELTSLRFFAAAWVVIHHFKLHLDIKLDQISGIFQRGHLGVDLFFVLSGFILFHVYYRGYEGGTFNYKRFIVNRFARIYPIHFVILTLTILVMLAAWSVGVETGSSLNGLGIFLNYVILHGWGFSEELTSINGPSWSISTEWFAYLLFPVFLAIGIKLWRRPLVFLGVAISTLLACAAIADWLGYPSLTWLAFHSPQLRIVPEFLLGCALYCLSCRITLRPAVAITALVATLAAWVWCTHVGVNNLIIIGLQAAVIFLFAQLSKHAIRSPLTWQWLIYLGETSYSLYIVHVLVEKVYYKVVEIGLGLPEQMPFLYWAPALVLAQVAASLGYHLVEKPGRIYLRRLSSVDFGAAVRRMTGRSPTPDRVLAEEPLPAKAGPRQSQD